MNECDTILLISMYLEPDGEKRTLVALPRDSWKQLFTHFIYMIPYIYMESYKIVSFVSGFLAQNSSLFCSEPILLLLECHKIVVVLILAEMTERSGYRNAKWCHNSQGTAAQISLAWPCGAAAVKWMVLVEGCNGGEVALALRSPSHISRRVKFRIVKHSQKGNRLHFRLFQLQNEMACLLGNFYFSSQSLALWFSGSQVHGFLPFFPFFNSFSF